MDLKRPEKKPWVPGHPTFRTERPISLLEYWYGHYYFKKPLLSAIHPDVNELCWRAEAEDKTWEGVR